jgi:hypothetical protein
LTGSGLKAVVKAVDGKPLVPLLKKVAGACRWPPTRLLKPTVMNVGKAVIRAFSSKVFSRLKT